MQIQNNITYKKFDEEKQEKKQNQYEEKLSKISQDWGVDKEWLRSCSYAAPGSNFSFFGQEYINVLHYLANDMGLGYVTLENFKISLRQTNILIEKLRIIKNKEDDAIKNINGDLKALDQLDGESLPISKLSDYHAIALNSINFTKKQIQCLMEIYQTDDTQDFDFIYCFIKKDSSLFVGASADAVHHKGDIICRQKVHYILNHNNLLKRMNSIKSGSVKGDAIFEYLPKIMETRLHRIAYGKMLSRSVELMRRMATIDQLQAIVDGQDEDKIEEEDQAQIAFNASKNNLILNNIKSFQAQQNVSRETSDNVAEENPIL